MVLVAQQSSSYRVEASGWDTAAAFFSEKTVLYWSPGGQEISLRSRMQPGMVIFVRLLQPFGGEENFPVPYVVTKNLPVEIDGRTTVAITRLHPKPSHRQSAPTLGDSSANCLSGTRQQFSCSALEGLSG